MKGILKGKESDKRRSLHNSNKQKKMFVKYIAQVNVKAKRLQTINKEILKQQRQHYEDKSPPHSLARTESLNIMALRSSPHCTITKKNTNNTWNHQHTVSGNNTMKQRCQQSPAPEPHSLPYETQNKLFRHHFFLLWTNIANPQHPNLLRYLGSSLTPASTVPRPVSASLDSATYPSPFPLSAFSLC